MGNSEKEFLSNYDENNYKRPSVTNDILIFTTEDKIEKNQRKVPNKGMQILLIKRDNHPDKGKWSLPGGFIEIDEGLEESAKNKLREKTGIDNVYIEQLYTFGDLDRDKRTRVITIAYMALIEKDKIQKVQAKNLKEIKWFWIEKNIIESLEKDKLFINKYSLELISEDGLDKIQYTVLEEISKDLINNKKVSYEYNDVSNDMLSFDHYKIIDYGIDRIRNKVEYTSIAFNLLPRLFTVKELQNVYEAIIGREILNFRRKMGDMIIETDEVIEGKPFRPAKVFRFNEKWKHNF